MKEEVHALQQCKNEIKTTEQRTGGAGPGRRAGTGGALPTLAALGIDLVRHLLALGPDDRFSMKQVQVLEHPRITRSPSLASLHASELPLSPTIPGDLVKYREHKQKVLV
ncbi:hypothetical protein PHYPSEUDO_006570 [Phytophthora pseudosyringae]|uniref:Uncharacterized protein n=1 Tax=Phytophthora pseudosyringae TaxID=221518 RepID=A0A8T1VLP1_9STRA|nr:hypothetical protein PHYPSEUDO_006570 [Phytophthora pseudosyringae]